MASREEREGEEEGEEEEEEGRLRFDQLGVRASQLKLPYYRHSLAGDEERYIHTWLGSGLCCRFFCL